MLPSRRVPSQVFETLDCGGLVLCANARSARHLSAAYGEDRFVREGNKSWRTPLITDWHAWLQAQWRQLLLTGSESRMLLTAFQEELLWIDIASPSLRNRSLIAPEELAALARSAYGLLGEHDAFDTLRQGSWDAAKQEPELFRAWTLEMQRRCERNHWLCLAQLTQVITTAIVDKRLPSPSATLWNGFDRLTPAQLKVRTALTKRGTRVDDLHWNLVADTKVVAATNAAEEAEACAHWAADIIRGDQDQRVAILVPDVQSRRAELDRTFRRVLQSNLTSVEAPAKKYEFTLGMPLSQVPVTQAAMLFLRWCNEPLEREAITILLTSGFFSDPGDVAALAAADLAVRRKFSAPDMSIEVALDRLYEFAGTASGSWAVANWVRRIRKARLTLETSSRQNKATSAPQWAAVISNVLEAAGWPGSRTMDTVAFQVLERWDRALEEVSMGSFDERRYDFRGFLGTLQSHLANVIFSPESQHPQITISGLPESAGQCFDAVWVLGMTDDAWPPQRTPHPLLPFSLQKDLAMPGTSSEIDRTFGAKVFERLQESAKTLVLSYATEGAAGAQRPNSTIESLNAQELAYEIPAQTDSDLRETFEEEMSVPWPGGYVKGGHQVFKQQSACPFQAFASARLGARELPSIQPGLSSADRGNIVHAALQNLWGKDGIQDSEQLQAAINKGELSRLVSKHVGQAFEKYEADASSVWEREYLQLETSRVCSLIEQWLHTEARRKPFRVHTLETKKPVSLDNLELEIRMDRIDQVEEGNILIDYKTGNVSKKKWEGDRPDEPQLPFYAVFGEVENLHDVLFAQVSNKDPHFISSVFGDSPGYFRAW